MFRLLLYIFITARPAFSTVSLLNPLNAQLPPIARVNQFFSWTVSPKTFESSDGASTIQFAASFVSTWLSFDPSTQTLHGTPSTDDEGTLDVTVLAGDGTSSASSTVTLCITSIQPPILRIPIEAQFYDKNPSLSSVFIVSPGSAIATTTPTLRVPPCWSFSIGFQGGMFEAPNDLFYDALQADGSALFDWIEFSPNTIVFSGVAPGKYNASSPQTVSLALHASDHEGYTSTSLPFDLVIAAHELSLSTPCLPTVNITANTPFILSLSSPDDFHGVLVDGNPIQPCDILALSIDVSQYSGWLKYDETSRTLSGAPPDGLASSGHLLPVVLTANFSQAIHTNVSLAIVPSYFSSSMLTPIQALLHQAINFSLVPCFSNATLGKQGDDDLTAAFEPESASGYLYFDPGTAQLTGTIPANYSSSSNSDIIVTFTAYSHVTHSTSHTSLRISPPSYPTRKDVNHSHPHGLSASAHAKLVLGLAISFGLMGGLALLGTMLAVFRHCARVSDTALGAEATRNAWTDSDRKWYGLGVDHGDGSNGYGWTEKAGRPAMDIENPFEPGQSQGGHQNPGALGLGLQRILTRTPSNPQSNNLGGHVRSPGAVMRKAEFLGKIKATVRKVSDKYTLKSASRRPIIGKPLLVTPTGVIMSDKDETLPFEDAAAPSAGPFDDIDFRSYAASTINTLTDSPTSSTEDRSIPRRRADFAPAKSPLVHFEDSLGPGRARKLSTDSDSSLASNASAITHAAEAIVQTATRTTSVRSAKSGSAVSYQSLLLESPQVAGTRPRLMPFTSATRVPVPRLPSSPLVADAGDSSRGGNRNSVVNQRVASQSAKVIEMDKNLDELSIGIHYVRSLGDDHQTSVGNTSAVFYTDPSTPTVSTNVRSSFSSLASSRQGNGLRGGKVKRILVRTGEMFKFRVAVNGDIGGETLVARLISGRALPQFLEVDLQEAVQRRGAVEFSGIPAARDIGEVNVGVYVSDSGECVARVILEVVGRSS